MSIYLSSDSMSDREAAKNVDLDGQLLDEDNDKEGEGMINAESCQSFDPRENDAPNESRLMETIEGCKKLLEMKQRHRALISNRRISLCGIPQRLRASQMRARTDDDENSVFHLPTFAPLPVDIGSGFFHAASLQPSTWSNLPAETKEMPQNLERILKSSPPFKLELLKDTVACMSTSTTTMTWEHHARIGSAPCLDVCGHEPGALCKWHR
jgi:hypothetical protein